MLQTVIKHKGRVVEGELRFKIRGGHAAKTLIPMHKEIVDAMLNLECVTLEHGAPTCLLDPVKYKDMYVITYQCLLHKNVQIPQLFFRLNIQSNLQHFFLYF